MFEYCKICPCNVDNICIFEIEEEPIDDVTMCVYPEMYDKEWYNQYIEKEKIKSSEKA